MDVYNQLLLQQLAPFIKINDSKCQSDITSQLRSNFNKYNILNSVWDNSIIKNRLLTTNYLIEFTDAWDIPVQLKPPSEDREDNANEVHSILSPFNPLSDIYPNGIISEDWFKKYIQNLPFAYVAAFPLPELVHDDGALIRELNELRVKYLAYGIKFVCILVSTSINPNDVDERVDKIRQQSGLPRLHGLLYLHANASKNVNLARDLTVLVTSLLSNLKHPSFEFYQQIEAKIKQRNKKYYSYPSAAKVQSKIVLTPTFLETRNLIKQGILIQFSSPHNVELSLKYLIPAYDNLIDLVRENFQSQQEDIEQHDMKLYTHFRLLLDVLAFHIVRCYLAAEDPISALRKHKTHIASVIEAVHFSPSTNYYLSEINNWISIQYQWLAQLLELIPQSIRVEPNPKKFGNTTTFYFGGVQFIDNGLKYDIITKPGLLYLKAAEYLDKVKVSKKQNKKNELHYKLLPEYEEPVTKQKKKLALLSKAKSCFVDSSPTSVDYKSEAANFDSFINYVNWIIAEEYFKLDDFKTAIEFYKLCNSLTNPLILQRIFECIEQISGSDKEALEIAIQISSIKSPILQVFDSNIAKTLNLENIKRVDCKLFEVTPLILNKHQSTTTYLYDECLFQIKLQPSVNFEKLNKLLQKKEIKIKVEEIKINFNTVAGFKDTLLKRLDSLPSTALQLVTLDEDFTGLFKIDFFNSSEAKIFEFTQVAEKIGKAQIRSIELETILEIDDANSISHTQSVEFETKSSIDEASETLFHNIKYYINNRTSESLLDYRFKNVRLNGESAYSVNVVPVRPKVNLDIKDPLKSLIMGEKVKLNILLDVEKRKGVDYNALSIVSDIKLSGGDSDDYTIRTSWNDLKDDEPLKLSEDSPDMVLLNLSIQSRPSIELKEGIKLMLNFKFVQETNTENTEGDVNIPTLFDISNFEFDLVKEPFELKYGIAPRYRNQMGAENDMPNPFIINKGSSISMPVATRAWIGNVTFSSRLSSSIDIISTNINIKSMNPEVQLDCLGLTVPQVHALPEPQTFSRSFVTTSKTGFTHRNVVVSSVGTIFWKRKNSEIINEFKSIYWEVTLPLADPRVLLMVKKGDDDSVWNLHYVIENPTPRIFSFSTQLLDEQDSGWGYIDELNLVPFVQPPFPVLPFLRHAIDFYAKYGGSKEEKMVKLPQLKVFDINYKVGLPTLSVSEDVTSVEGLLYFKK